MAENMLVCTATRATSFPLKLQGTGGINETPFLGRMRMKAMKIALLGTAALAAVSVSARADNLSDLKAQIEALNARVASIETTSAVPAGYQMVSFSKVGNDHVISIMPTADMPASTTITWSGYVWAAVQTVYDGRNLSDSYATDILTRAELSVTGKTDTAVGEVGVSVNLRASSYGTHTTNTGNPDVVTDGYWGYWKLTPNVTLGGGVGGSIAKNGYTYDAQCYHCYLTDYFGGISNHPDGDPSQMKLSYADGPLSFAVAVEDGQNSGNSSAFGVTGNIGYSMDTFGVDLTGGYWGAAEPGDDAAWVVTAGIGANFNPFSIGAAVGFGHTYSGSDYTKASGYIKLALSDTAHFDVGVSHQFGNGTGGYEFTEYDAGLYYEPVNKLTIGLEGLYQAGDGPTFGDGAYVADLITVWKF